MEKLIKPPIGLQPKDIYLHNVNLIRLEDVCGAISRYYGAGLKIPVEWIEEYNELIDLIEKE